MEFHDHFSGHAAQYAEARPRYPDELFAHLAELAPGRELAWDCGTGNGQAAAALSRWFRHVLATDASVAQLAQAPTETKGVVFGAAAAEGPPLPDDSADLVTVAQAVHWFDHDRFWPEVARVLRPGGVVAVWCYDLMSVDPAVDALVHELYRDIVGEYWPPERAVIETAYRTLSFPFEEFDFPRCEMQHAWSLDQLTGYLATWSSVQGYMRARGEDPIRLIAERLAAAWGPAGERRTITWPIYTRVGRYAP